MNTIKNYIIYLFFKTKRERKYKKLNDKEDVVEFQH